MMPLKTLRTRTRKKILLINENSEDTGSDNEDQGEDSSSSDTVASISIHSRIFLTDTMQEETEEETKKNEEEMSPEEFEEEEE